MVCFLVSEKGLDGIAIEPAGDETNIVRSTSRVYRISTVDFMNCAGNALEMRSFQPFIYIIL
jgi:hypothetical protein